MTTYGFSFEYTTTAPNAASPITPATRAPDRTDEVPPALLTYESTQEGHDHRDHEQHDHHAVGELHDRMERERRRDAALGARRPVRTAEARIREPDGRPRDDVHHAATERHLGYPEVNPAERLGRTTHPW